LNVVLSREPARRQLPTGRESFHVWSFPDGTVWMYFYRSGENYLLRFPELADFEVSADGHSVRCRPVIGISEDTLDHLYLNQVLPLAMSRQGKFVFHASAIETGSGALVFMGESGRGKSTLAASFATSGFRFLTDDGLLVEEVSGRYQVLPSHPSIRLWEDSEEALVTDEVPIAPPVQYTSKARFLAGEELAFCGETRPLWRVYFLGEGTGNRVEFTSLSPSKALIELVKHSFLLDIEEQTVLAQHFDRLTRLVNRPMFYRLDYPRRYEMLALVRQAIIEHATQESEVA
jgi:hypothetical protein